MWLLIEQLRQRLATSLVSLTGHFLSCCAMFSKLFPKTKKLDFSFDFLLLFQEQTLNQVAWIQVLF